MLNNPPLLTLLSTYNLVLESDGKATKTRYAYLGAVKKLADVIGDKPIKDVTEYDVREFVVKISRDPAYKPASLNNYVRSLRSFFRWAMIDWIDVDPMVRIKTPKLRDEPLPVPSNHELNELLVAVGERKRTFAAARDVAIIRLFMATGIRRSELAGMSVDSYNRATREIRVDGKTGPRLVGISGSKAQHALERYLVYRADYAVAHGFAADAGPMWLGPKGALTTEGVYQMVKRRAREAGIAVHPHQFRHWYASGFLASGGQETELMSSAGWVTRQMVARYSAHDAAVRASVTSQRLGIGDRV